MVTRQFLGLGNGGSPGITMAFLLFYFLLYHVTTVSGLLGILRPPWTGRALTGHDLIRSTSQWTQGPISPTHIEIKQYLDYMKYMLPVSAELTNQSTLEHTTCTRYIRSMYASETVDQSIKAVDLPVNVRPHQSYTHCNQPKFGSHDILLVLLFFVLVNQHKGQSVP